jgi:phage terminase large subunit
MSKGEVVVTIPYKPRPQQRAIHDLFRKGARFGVLVCHRRFGKTVLAVNQLIRGAIECKKDRPRFGLIGPTYSQEKSAAWDYLVHYSSPFPGVKVNQSELRVDFPNGGQVRIYGADNPQSLRGLYFDGIVLDEASLMARNVYSEVLRATLVDRQGWSMFCGTPNGRDNELYDQMQTSRAREFAGDADWFFRSYPASETGLVPEQELAKARAVMTRDEYAQEYECSFEASVKGAIYTRELEECRVAGRITSVPYDPALPVDTDWDLGIGDAMAVWFSQSLRSGEVRLIDYYEASGEGFPHYATMLRGRGYSYGKHWAPHDIQVRELSSGRSRLEVALALGIRFDQHPRIHDAMAGEVEEGIHAVRMLLPRCWFDAEKCKAGLEALMHYRRDYNQRLNEFKATPVHDWASHASDALRGLAVRHQIPREQKRAEVPPMPAAWGWS